MKKTPALQSYRAKEVTIQTPHTNELIALDGEPLELKTPLNIKIIHHGLNLVVPEQKGEP